MSPNEKKVILEDSSVQESLKMLTRYDLKEMKSSIYSRDGGANMDSTNLPLFIKDFGRKNIYIHNKASLLRTHSNNPHRPNSKAPILSGYVACRI
jgi:hypothetical protein